MKKLALAVLLMQPALLFAAPKANPADYTVTVHVISSHSGPGNSAIQRLETLIDGRQTELCGDSAGVLLLGDYRAKLLNLPHLPKPNGYDSYVAYELLFQNGEVRKYFVTGYGPADPR